MLIIVMMFFQQMSGINLIIFFSGVVCLKDYTWSITLANFLATIIVFRCVDRIGRRPLLIMGGSALTILLFVVTLRSAVPLLKNTYDSSDEIVLELSRDLLIVFTIYGFAFGVSYGPVGYFSNLF